MAPKQREEDRRIPLGAVRLTRREVEVLELIAEGLTSVEVAERLFICKRTVDFHLANLFYKLRARNRLSACRAAAHLGLIYFEPTFPYLRPAEPADRPAAYLS